MQHLHGDSFFFLRRCTGISSEPCPSGNKQILLSGLSAHIAPGYAIRSENHTYIQDTELSIPCYMPPKAKPCFLSLSFRPRMASPSGSRSSSPCPGRLSHHRPQTGKPNLYKFINSTELRISKLLIWKVVFKICKDITFTLGVSLPSALQNMNPSQRCR